MKKILLSLTILIGATAFAKPYGDAGCGLGSIVFADSPSTASQVFAATTNDSTATNMFGITSGTSNCIDSGTVKGAMAVPAFIEVNKVALAEDVSRGQGETLAGLAKLMGCHSDNFGTTLKRNYGKIFVDTKMDPTGIEAGINSSIAADKVNACGA